MLQKTTENPDFRHFHGFHWQACSLLGRHANKTHGKSQGLTEFRKQPD